MQSGPPKLSAVYPDKLTLESVAISAKRKEKSQRLSTQLNPGNFRAIPTTHCSESAPHAAPFNSEG